MKVKMRVQVNGERIDLPEEKREKRDVIPNTYTSLDFGHFDVAGNDVGIWIDLLPDEASS